MSARMASAMAHPLAHLLGLSKQEVYPSATSAAYRGKPAAKVGRTAPSLAAEPQQTKGQPSKAKSTLAPRVKARPGADFSHLRQTAFVETPAADNDGMSAKASAIVRAGKLARGELAIAGPALSTTAAAIVAAGAKARGETQTEPNKPPANSLAAQILAAGARARSAG